MRMLFRFAMDTATANELAEVGALGETIGKIVAETKPECVYFAADQGQRAAYMVVDLKGAHEIPKICEPWFLAFEADVEVQPVMTPEDLEKAGPAIAAAAKKYA